MQRAYRDRHGSLRIYAEQPDEPQCIDINPSRDLICLQLQNLNASDWKAFSDGIKQEEGNLWGLRGLEHVAIDFNPSWFHMKLDKNHQCIDKSLTRDPGRVLADIICELECFRHFWAIDYTISHIDPNLAKPCWPDREDNPTEDGPVYVFYCVGRRFVEPGVFFLTSPEGSRRDSSMSITMNTAEHWDRFQNPVLANIGHLCFCVLWVTQT